MIFRRERKQEDDYLEKAVLGDREGFEYLVNAYKNLAYTIAFKICLNNEDAEEVVQDAFMKAFSSLGSFRRASKFSTWLYRIVYNTAMTKINTKTITRAEINDQSGEDCYLLEGNNEINPLLQADRKKYINLALSKLVEDERIVVTLYYLGERSISEIAQILDLKKSAIKMRLLRGRKKLENSLKLLLDTELKDLLCC